MSDMPRIVRASSEGRFWTGFDATLIDTAGGVIELTQRANHHVSMDVGGPVRASCRVAGRTHRRLQQPGDIDIVPLGYTARWEDAGPTSMLSIHISPALVRTAAEGMGVDADRIALAPQMQLTDAHAQHVCWAILAELKDGDPNFRLYADSLGLALAAYLLRRYAPIVPEKVPRKLSRSQSNRLLEYLSANLDQNLSLAELAAVAGMSASHLKALFKESVGVPVHRYVIERRVEAAANLLLTGKPPSEVAARIGFADQSHMTRTMRRVLGVTPGEISRLF